MQYKYEKTCKTCKAVYYSKTITEDQFSNIADNDNITVVSNNGTQSAQIKSLCEECGDKENDKNI